MSHNELKDLLLQLPYVMLLGGTRAIITLMIVPFITATGLSRQALILGIMVIVAPMTCPMLIGKSYPTWIALALTLKEVFLGMLLGFFMAIIFWGIEVAGEMIDLQRGATAGGVYNPMLGAQESPTGGFFLRTVSYVFFATGGALGFLDILMKSYEVYPIDHLLPPFVMGWQKTTFVFLTRVFELGVLYASPLLIIFFFSDFGLGLVNRFVPQLNVFFISLPIKSGLCFFFLIFYMTFVIAAFEKDLFTSETVFAFFRGVFQ